MCVVTSAVHEYVRTLLKLLKLNNFNVVKLERRPMLVLRKSKEKVD